MHLITPLLSSNNPSIPFFISRNRNPQTNNNRIVLEPSRRRPARLRTPHAANNGSSSGGGEYGKKKKSWWRSFFLEEDGDWLGLKEEDMVESEEEVWRSSVGGEEERFEEWRKRAEAIVEVREAREGFRNQEERSWEDWVVVDDDWGGGGGGGGGGEEGFVDEIAAPERGLVERVGSFLSRAGDDEDEDMLYEDRVFRYASINSGKFLAILIIVPWALDFLVHDYALMPFLDRYVQKVPLAAQILDVRRSQKLEMVKELKVEGARLRFEAEIGKIPPLSEEETWQELHHTAIELRDEKRLDNRRAFANIWSDMLFGISLFLLLYFNQSQVALLKFTGYKILNNMTDTGKAFLIILVTDIFLGYHSESGWQTVCEIIVEHYGFEVDQAAITIFICLVPVMLDACVKLWLFKFLPRLSPKVSNIFNEMKRH